MEFAQAEAEAASAIKRMVRREYPDAEVRPDGMMFVVTAGEKLLSQRKTTTDKAWMSALLLIKANRP